MTQTWNGKEIHADCKYDSNFKSAFFWGCDDGFTSLPILINRCQNMIISKHYWEGKEAPDLSEFDPHSIAKYYREKPVKSPINDDYMRVNDMKVYVNQKVFDLFIDTMKFNFKDYFTIEIDETVDDDMIIVSSIDKKYIEAIQIV